MSYFNNHSHTEFSNLRLLDCINKPEELIDKAIEVGLTGIAITDHESLSAHMRVNKYTKKSEKAILILLQLLVMRFILLIQEIQDKGIITSF